MNLEQTTLPPVPMVKDVTVKDDGRFLIYYSFPDTPAEGTTEAQKREDADV